MPLYKLDILVLMLCLPILITGLILLQTALMITTLALELLLLPVLLIALLALAAFTIIAFVDAGFRIGLNNDLKTVASNLTQECNIWLKVLLAFIPGFDPHSTDTKKSELIFEKLETKPGCFSHTTPDLTSENPEVSKLIKDYKELKDKVSAAIDNKDVDQSDQYNELIPYTDIKELIILVKHYKGPDKKWHVVPGTTNIGDKSETQRWCDSEQSQNMHPRNRDDLKKPTPYNNFKTRYVWFKCDNINQIQELAEIAEAIDSKLVKCPPKEEKKSSYLSVVFSMFSTPKKEEADLLTSVNYLV